MLVSITHRRLRRDVPRDILTYQLAGSVVANQGDDGCGGLVFNSGEGARVKATTSKDGSSAQLVHSQREETVKRDSDFRYGERYLLCLTQKVCNVCALHQRASINWRTNPVPAPAVIPVPVAYSNVVAFKTLVSRRRTEHPCGTLGSLWPAFGFENGAVRWSTFGSIRRAIPRCSSVRRGLGGRVSCVSQ
jgi:hypothetical protein